MSSPPGDPTPERAEIDGVPVLWLPLPGPLRASLQFRGGQADEALAERGITHLIEHLALVDMGHQTYDYNAFVDETRTVLHMRGAPAQVAEHLRRVTAALSALPAQRVEAERRVLSSEEEMRPPGTWAGHRRLRFGARGFGLIDFWQYGLRHLEAEDVLPWAASRFTAGNAVLWLTGEPPPGLGFELPSGSPLGPPPWEPLDRATPSHREHSARGAGISMVGLRTPELVIGARIAARRLREALRWQQGIAYAPNCDYRPLDIDHAHLLVHSDALPEQSESVVKGMLEVLSALRTDGPSDAELADDQASYKGARENPEWLLGVLDRCAQVTLGLDRHIADGMHERVTPTGIARALEDAWSSAIVLVPAGHAGEAAALPALPAFSGAEETVEGTWLRRRLAGPDEPPWGTRLQASEEGLSMMFGIGKWQTVRYENTEALLWWHSGLRVLIGRDGTTLRFRASDWEKSDAVLDQIDELVPEVCHVPMDPPGTDAEAERRSCEICGARPAIPVRVVKFGLNIMDTFSARLCKDCGRQVARRWTAILLQWSWVFFLVPALALGFVFNSVSLVRLSLLDPPQRADDRSYWLPGQPVFKRWQLYLFIFMALVCSVIGLGYASLRH